MPAMSKMFNSAAKKIVATVAVVSLVGASVAYFAPASLAGLAAGGSKVALGAKAAMSAGPYTMGAIGLGTGVMALAMKG